MAPCLQHSIQRVECHGLNVPWRGLVRGFGVFALASIHRQDHPRQLWCACGTPGLIKRHGWHAIGCEWRRSDRSRLEQRRGFERFSEHWQRIRHIEPLLDARFARDYGCRETKLVQLRGFRWSFGHQPRANLARIVVSGTRRFHGHQRRRACRLCECRSFQLRHEQRERADPHGLVIPGACAGRGRNGRIRC